MLIRVIEKENISDKSGELLIERDCKAMKWLVKNENLTFDKKECNQCKYAKEKCLIKDREQRNKRV